MSFTVMVVDDSPVMRTFIRRVMRLAGFDDAEYVEASDGMDALEQLKSKRVDVILTDINMPKMDGEALLAELDKIGILAATPVVVISTDATRDRVHRMLALGAKGYISKPFAPEILREELDRVLEEQNAATN